MANRYVRIRPAAWRSCRCTLRVLVQVGCREVQLSTAANNFDACLVGEKIWDSKRRNWAGFAGYSCRKGNL